MRSILYFAIVIAVAASGCGGGANQKELAEVGKSADKTTPSDVVKGVAEGLGNHQPVVLWHAMPASYQADVRQLLDEFQERVDAEVYNRTFEVARKAVELFRVRKEFLLDQPIVSLSPVSKDAVRANWEHLTVVLETLLESRLATAASLEGLEPEQFLQETGADLMKELAELDTEDPYSRQLERLTHLEADDTEIGDKRVEVKLKFGDEEPTRIAFVQVEDQWIPAHMADNWESWLDDAEATLDLVALWFNKGNRQQSLEQLDRIDAGLDRMLEAPTDEAFAEAFREFVKEQALPHAPEAQSDADLEEPHGDPPAETNVQDQPGSDARQ